MLRFKAFFVKYRQGITNGILAGILLSNFFLLSQGSQTSSDVLKISQQTRQQIEDDNKERERNRKESADRAIQTQNYIKCIAQILIATRNNTQEVRIKSLEECDLQIDDNNNLVSPNVTLPSQNNGSEAGQNQPQGSSQGNKQSQQENPPANNNQQNDTATVELPKAKLCVPFTSICTTIK